MSILYIFVLGRAGEGWGLQKHPSMDALWTIGVNVSVSVNFLNFSLITITKFVVAPFSSQRRLIFCTPIVIENEYSI